MTHCPKCTFDCADDSKYCAQCGAACHVEVSGSLNSMDCLSPLESGNQLGLQTNPQQLSSATKMNPAPEQSQQTKLSSQANEKHQTGRIETSYCNDLNQPEIDLDSIQVPRKNRHPWLILSLSSIGILVLAGFASWYWISHKTNPDTTARMANSAHYEETVISADDPTLKSPSQMASADSTQTVSPKQFPTTPLETPPVSEAATKAKSAAAASASTVAKAKQTSLKQDEDDDFGLDDYPGSKVLLKQAERALRKKRYDEAAELAQTVLSNEPENLRARQILVQARLHSD